MFQSLFQEEQDIGGAEVLTRIAGRDAAGFRRALEARAYVDRFAVTEMEESERSE
ncbi:MAG: hypothetical protein LAN61_01290 [Acidobacteriia bacterium]|nr:hypothetical protein [Terriglobia bacterium]